MKTEVQSQIVSTFLSRPALRPTLVMNLISFLVLLVFSELYWNDLLTPESFWVISKARWFDGAALSALTSLFIHSDLQHLLSNTVSMVVLAHLLYGYFGWHTFPLISIVMGVITNILTVMTMPLESTLVGASGMVYAMAGFWLGNYLGIERRFGVGVRVVRVIGFTLAVLAPTSYEPRVSYMAHFIGFLVGLVSGLIYFFVRRSTFRKFEVVKVEEPVIFSPDEIV